MIHTLRCVLWSRLWRACSRNFTKVAVYLVVQVYLSRWKVVRCGKLTLLWTLDRWQSGPSRRANHAITRQDSKIYRLEIEDIVALDLCWSFYRLPFSRCRGTGAKDTYWTTTLVGRSSTYGVYVCGYGGTRYVTQTLKTRTLIILNLFPLYFHFYT